ncbi:MAG TPA: carbohydrate ABC transporter permease [Candidatus Mediterraneibacter tabaqchaliae]|uniref:Carbohydrate ABC transporter permease n=1 Tax=Candidatus Mediterraneibacter tabaqchaliae TaxID=2838689 RepID=A0A9D2U1A8_9FIRM|nr:carbohydrate ABC transporter permease [Candidatus Mediterraneibacter tabaqchaliae]
MKTKSGGKTIAKIFMIVFFLVLTVLILIPIWVIFIGSFQDGDMLVRYGLNLGIDLAEANLDNWVMLFTNSGSYFTWFFNSVLLTVLQVVGTLLISAFVAYGFAAYEFRFKNFFFVCVLLIMSVPFEMLMLPLYVQINDMGLADSYAAVLLPFLANAMTIFFFRQYLMGTPKEIIEAGRIDGATEYGIFFKLIMPIMKPSFAAMAILNGMNSWNNFLWPLLVLRSSEKYTLPIGLNTLITPYGNNYDLLIVGSFFSVLPILILFLCFQKYFIEGMTAGAVKG